MAKTLILGSGQTAFVTVDEQYRINIDIRAAQSPEERLKIYSRAYVPAYLQIDNRTQFTAGCSVETVDPDTEHTIRVIPFNEGLYYRYGMLLQFTDRGIVTSGNTLFTRRHSNSSLSVVIQYDLGLRVSEVDNKLDRIYIEYPQGYSLLYYQLGRPTDYGNCPKVDVPAIGYYSTGMYVAVFYNNSSGLCGGIHDGYCGEEHFCNVVDSELYGQLFTCSPFTFDGCKAGCPSGTTCGLVSGIKTCISTETAKPTCAVGYLPDEEGTCQPIPAPCSDGCGGNCFNNDACPAGTVCARSIYSDPGSFLCTSEPYVPVITPEKEQQNDDRSKWALILASICIITALMILLFVCLKQDDSHV